MKKRILAVILGMVMVCNMTACIGGDKAEDAAIEPARDNSYESTEFSPEQLMAVISDVQQEENNAKYRNKDFREFAVSVAETGDYIKVSIPQEFVEEQTEGDLSAGRLNIPVKVDGHELSLQVSCSQYDYEREHYPEAVINSYYKMCVTSYGYECHIRPGNTESAYRIVYDKEGSESYTSYQRFAVKALRCGSAVVVITLSSEMSSANKDIIMEKQKAVEVLDSLNFESGLKEIEAESINSGV